MSLAPILLYPAFRYGAATPWGGDQLKARYGKPTPDTRTGESLEMSVIPGLNSTDAQGTPLSELIVRYGAQLTGTQITGEFPLLLKLLGAKQALSVQVHPDDAYAQTHENKLGKTEAWIILAAEPGAQLVYGLRPGVTRDMLRQAFETEAPLEPLLRFVPVQAGDVFYIPAGMVHAIGGGILLYEIQQSSDVTYRFYDWNRTDAQGNKRPLHIRQALDVVRPELQLEAVQPQPLADAHCRRELLLDTPYFRVERLNDCQEVPFSAHPEAFSVLTALSDGQLSCPEGRLSCALPAGQTVLLPADCLPFTLSGGTFLISAPRA